MAKELGAHFSGEETNLGLSIQEGLPEIAIYPRKAGAALAFRLTIAQSMQLRAALDAIESMERSDD